MGISFDNSSNMSSQLLDQNPLDKPIDENGQNAAMDPKIAAALLAGAGIAPPIQDGGNAPATDSGGQAVKVGGLSIQAPKAPVTTASSNLEAVQTREAMDNVTKMGLPDLGTPRSGGFVASLGSNVAALLVDFVAQMKQQSSDAMNMRFEGAMQKIKDQVKTMEQQARTALGMGIASGVIGIASGIGFAAGGMKSMTSSPGVGPNPAAQVTESKLTLGKEILHGMITGVESGKESQMTALGAEVKSEQMDQTKEEQMVEQHKKFADNLKQLLDMVLSSAQEINRDQNQTTQRILA